MPPHVRAAAENKLELVTQLISSKEKRLVSTAAAMAAGNRKVDECGNNVAGARICHLPNSFSTAAANTQTITSVLDETIDTAADNERTGDSQKCEERGFKSCSTKYDSDESSGISSSKLESDSDESGGNLSDNTERDDEEDGDDYMDECYICNDGGGKYKVLVFVSISVLPTYTNDGPFIWYRPHLLRWTRM